MKSADTQEPLDAPRARRPIGIRSAFLVPLVVAVWPLLMVQGGVYWYWLHTIQAREVQTGKELSRSLAATFRAYVNEIGRQESTLEEVISAQSPCSSEEVVSLLDASAHRFPALNAFLFIDPNGRIQASSDRRLIGLWVGNREYFQRAIRTHDLVLSDLLEGRVDPKPIFVVARAVYRGPELLGVLSGSVEPDRLAEATLKVVGFKEGSACFFDRQGRLVYRYPAREMIWPERKNSETGDLLEKALRGEEAAGVIRYAGDDKDHFALRMPVEDFGWVAGVSMPQDSIHRPLARIGAYAGAVSLGVVGLSIAGAWWMSRGMIRSILAVRRQAMTVGRGDLTTVAETGRIREIKDLEVAFNQMVRSQREAQETQARYKTLVEESLVGVYFIQDGVFVYTNPRMSEIFGYPPDGILGKTVLDLVAPSDRDRVAENLRRRVTGQIQSVRYTFQAIRKDETEITVEVIGARTIYHGRPAILGTLIDISDRVRNERRIKTVAAELARSNRDLEQFAAITSHDLQEPLRMVSGHLGVIRLHLEGKLDDETSQSMDFAIDGATRMQTLILDLLAYSRVGRKGEGFLPTDMAATAAKVQQNLQAAIADSHATIAVGPLPIVQAEPGQMAQLLQNLLGNAIKYVAAGVPPHIEVKARRGEREWVFSIGDNGIGISPADADRIFMIFTRLHSRSDYPGTGIGLAICKRIVEYHGGRIWVESSVGQGSTFHFAIPDRD